MATDKWLWVSDDDVQSKPPWTFPKDVEVETLEPFSPLTDVEFMILRLLVNTNPTYDKRVLKRRKRLYDQIPDYLYCDPLYSRCLKDCKFLANHGFDGHIITHLIKTSKQVDRFKPNTDTESARNNPSQHDSDKGNLYFYLNQLIEKKYLTGGKSVFMGRKGKRLKPIIWLLNNSHKALTPFLEEFERRHLTVELLLSNYFVDTLVYSEILTLLQNSNKELFDKITTKKEEEICLKEGIVLPPSLIRCIICLIDIKKDHWFLIDQLRQNQSVTLDIFRFFYHHDIRTADNQQLKQKLEESLKKLQEASQSEPCGS